MYALQQYYNIHPRACIIYGYYYQGAFNSISISISALLKIVDEGAGIDSGC